jgi:hypothetical protein
MRKDIKIPKVEHISMAVIHEYAPSFKQKDWNVYLINESSESLDMVLVVSKGANVEKDIKTSVIRRKINSLPPQSFAKIEFIPDELLDLDNIFQVSFFKDNVMYEKDFIFKRSSIKVDSFCTVPIIGKQGVLAT